MPYPAPLTNLDGHRSLYKNPDRRRAEFHLVWSAKQSRRHLEILIAGCGTSQAARYALREPDARITAIDVSETSLRHTRDLLRNYDLKTLELHKLAIKNIVRERETRVRSARLSRRGAMTLSCRRPSTNVARN
jgi:SAM-dependent methyltransferase